MSILEKRAVAIEWGTLRELASFDFCEDKGSEKAVNDFISEKQIEMEGDILRDGRPDVIHGGD